jgi:hypothetical protein
MNNISYPKSMLEERDNGERDFHWVDINTRTPHESGEYLVNTTNDQVIICGYNNNSKEFFDDINLDYKVTAWTKKPNPYKTNKL